MAMRTRRASPPIGNSASAISFASAAKLRSAIRVAASSPPRAETDGAHALGEAREGNRGLPPGILASSS